MRSVSGERGASGVLVATCISTLVVNANTSAVSILLPTISEDTGSPVSTLQWAVTGYSLVGAACIVTSGALGDVFGRRKIFLGGLFLFIGSCVLIARSTEGLGVVLGRCVQGAAGSTILACGLSLLTLATGGDERLRAVSLWGAASAIGAAAGPLVGGLLVDSTGWQGLFWIDAAIAAACIPITLRSITESNDPNRSRSIDWLGTVLVAMILAPMILGFSKGADWGWGSAATITCFVVSVASVFGFVVAEKRSPAPLVDLALLRNRLLIGGTIGILIGAGTINGLMFIMSLFFQDPAGLEMSAFEAGLATLPATAGLVVATPFIPKLANRFGSRQVILSGFVAMTAGFVLFLGTSASWEYRAFIIPVVLIAVGMALSNGPCSSISTSAVAEEQVGAASGISNMARYVGAAVMTAIVATVYAEATASEVDAGASAAEALATGFARSSLVLALVSASGIALAMLAGRHRPPAPLPVDQAAAAASTSHTLPTPHPDSPARGLTTAG
jgi:EmrB/QacA subfamily drug resistance transporter